MAKGRKKKPTKLKMIQGTFRADRANPNEPDPDVNIPIAPDFLKGPALEEWKRITVELEQSGLMTNMDMAALALYCQAWGRVVKYEKIIEEKGELYKTQGGNIQMSPAMWVLNKAYDYVYKFMTEFGLTPSSRSKVAAKPKKEETNKYAKMVGDSK